MLESQSVCQFICRHLLCPGLSEDTSTWILSYTLYYFLVVMIVLLKFVYYCDLLFNIKRCGFLYCMWIYIYLHDYHIYCVLKIYFPFFLILGLLIAVNCHNVKWAAKVQVVITASKLIALAIIIVIGLYYIIGKGDLYKLTL